MADSKQPKIFEYLDYRQFLVDVYSFLRSNNPRLSKREFARIANSTSPNFLQFIHERKLHLTNDSLNALSRYLCLSPKEKRYFESLVAFDHAKNHEEKNLYFQHIISSRDYGSFKQLQEDQYEYLAHWYMPVIRELVTCNLYPDKPIWIAEQIIPPISESVARKGILLLEKLGLIYREKTTNKWVQSEKIISTPSEVLSVAVVNYYKNLLALGKDAIERFDPSERDIRGVTVGISEETYLKLKSQMESFWQQVMATANEPQEVERVYHLGLLLFPLSKGKHK